MATYPFQGFWEFALANMDQKWNHIARDPLHHFSSPQACPTHSMAIKQSMGRWNLKKVTKKGAFQGQFSGILGQEEVVLATKWV